MEEHTLASRSGQGSGRPGWAAEWETLGVSCLPAKNAPKTSCLSTRALEPSMSVLERDSGAKEVRVHQWRRARGRGSAHISLGQQAWAELHVVFQIKGPAGLEF